MGMKDKIWTAIVSGMLLLVAAPAFVQADEAEQDDPGKLQAHQERAIIELFQNLQLDLEEGADLGEILQRELDPLQEVRREAIRLQRGLKLTLEDPGIRDQQLEREAKAYINPFADQPRAAVVAALGHEDFAVRESAEAFLLSDDTLGQAAIQSLIKEAGCHEVCHRLLRVAEHHVLREMRDRDFGLNRQAFITPPSQRASIGYSYKPVMAHENMQAKLPGVRVIATMPGFPGHAHLRQGDIIVQIAGQSLAMNLQHHDINNWVRRLIAAHAAGDTMSLIVLRSGELLKIELVCAQGTALDQMYTTDVFETAARIEPYKRQWQQVQDELMACLPKPKTLTPKVIESAESW